MPAVPSPFDDQVQRLRQRLDRKKHGPNYKKAQRKFAGAQTRQYNYQQANRPQAPIPYSGAYETEVGGLRNQLNQSQADIAGRGLATEQQYGFGADTSNPYSQARLLERNAAAQRASSLNSYARSGQLYAGSLSRKRASDEFGAGQALDVSLREYQAKRAELDREGLSAQTGYDTGVLAAEAKRLEAGLQEPVDPAEAPGVPDFVKQHRRNQQRRQNRQGGNDNLRNRLQKRKRRNR